MSSRRAVLGGVLGAAAAAGLVGCGGQAGTDPTGAATGKPSGPLLLWDFGTEDLAKHDDPFFTESHPGIELTHVVHPAADYATLLQTAITAPNGPDLVIIGGGIQIGSFAPALQPLDDRITPDQRDNLVGWDSMRAKHDPDNPILGMPFNMQTWVTYYNKELFTKAGLDPDTPPASMPELTEACDKLKAAGITPYSMGDAENAQAQVWFEAFEGTYATAEQAYQVATGERSWTSPEIKAAFSVFLDFIDAGYFQKTWRTDGAFTQQPDLFSTGKVAMTMQLTTYSGIFDKALGEGKLGAFFNPAEERGGTAHYLLGGPGKAACMTKRSKNKEAAWAWLTWKDSLENQQRSAGEIADGTGSFPSRKDVTVPDNATPVIRTLLETFANEPLALSSFSLAIPPPEVGREVQQTFGEVVDGKMTLDAFLAKLDQVHHS